MKLELDHGAFLEIYEQWLPADLARQLRQRVESELPWEQRSIQLFGRRVMQPRLIAWCGDEAYRYSGQTLEPRPWTASTELLRQRVEQTANLSFNHLLANLYRDGNDSMGFHADDEAELGEEPQVASVSFGASRRFRLKPKKQGRATTLELQDNTLLLMRGSTQQTYVHGVPKQAEITGRRLNLTFRRILSSPPRSGR